MQNTMKWIGGLLLLGITLTVLFYGLDLIFPDILLSNHVFGLIFLGLLLALPYFLLLFKQSRRLNAAQKQNRFLQDEILQLDTALNNMSVGVAIMAPDGTCL